MLHCCSRYLATCMLGTTKASRAQRLVLAELQVAPPRSSMSRPQSPHWEAVSSHMHRLKTTAQLDRWTSFYLPVRWLSDLHAQPLPPYSVCDERFMAVRIAGISKPRWVGTACAARRMRCSVSAVTIRTGRWSLPCTTGPASELELRLWLPSRLGTRPLSTGSASLESIARGRSRIAVRFYLVGCKARSYSVSTNVIGHIRFVETDPDHETQSMSTLQRPPAPVRVWIIVRQNRVLVLVPHRVSATSAFATSQPSRALQRSAKCHS